jgi:hypothetical protein
VVLGGFTRASSLGKIPPPEREIYESGELIQSVNEILRGRKKGEIEERRFWKGEIEKWERWGRS